MNDCYAEVIVSITHKDVDRVFHYGIPDRLKSKVQLGMRVLVPFGTGNKKIEAYVIGFTDSIDFPSSKLKMIGEVIDEYPIFDEHMIQLAWWMKEQYSATMADCLQCIMPTGIGVQSQWIIQLSESEPIDQIQRKVATSKLASKLIVFLLSNNYMVSLDELEEAFGKRISNTIYNLKKKGIIVQKQISQVKNYTRKVKFISLNEDVDIDGIYEECIKRKYYAQGRIIQFLRNNHQIPVGELKQILQVSSSSIQSLIKKQVIIMEEIEVKRDPYQGKEIETTKAFQPTSEQINVIEYIQNKLSEKNHSTILLHGITGSGKTEVYLQLINSVLQRGKQAIVLVPEISLTPQMVKRFVGRFGEKVAFTHSKLSLGERFDQWKKAKDEEVSIMVGPRSAIFTPFSRLGLIILDEEHETTYKSETVPKYHTRDIAIERSKMQDGVVLLASATPSIETYFYSKEGTYDLLTMTKRATKAALPKVDIVDMREELTAGNRSVFSRALQDEIRRNLEKKEQTILFLNRRGHSTFVSCRSCGFVLKCENCNISYTYHSHSSKLVCHYCGNKIGIPKRCPQCGSPYIKYFGVGTQKIEEEVKSQYPEAKVLRMDVDTTSTKFGHEKILETFSSEKADILIGTQMIAKGHDFPKVTLVGIIAADLSLHIEDFRSAERTFQLITQVAGRAGRGQLKGRVLIQTYTPDHYSIQTAQRQDYEDFYKQEIILRDQLVYPPFTHIFSVLITGENEKKVIRSSFRLAEIFHHFNRKRDFELLGPSPATLSKIKNQYRWRILIKGKECDRLRKYGAYCIEKYRKTEASVDIRIQSDLNPLILY